MNTKTILFTVTAALSIGIVSSCKKKVSEITDQQRNFSNNALIQVYVGTVSATRNYVYVDGLPVTGAGLATGGLFPSTGYASSVLAGSRNIIIKDTLSTSTQVQLSFNQSFTGNSNYTIFTYDTITSPKQLVVETPLNLTYNNSAQLRFANIVYSKNAIPAVDVFSKRKNSNVFTNMPVTAVSAFIPIETQVTDTFIVRTAGTTTQLAVINSLLFQQKRAYTLVFRGSYALTTGTNARTLSLFTNY